MSKPKFARNRPSRPIPEIKPEHKEFLDAAEGEVRTEQAIVSPSKSSAENSDLQKAVAALQNRLDNAKPVTINITLSADYSAKFMAVKEVKYAGKSTRAIALDCLKDFIDSEFDGLV